MHINNIRDLVQTDLQQMDKLILSSLQSEIPLINQIGGHIIQSGGKRLRPLLALLSAKAVAYSGEQHIDLAVIIEFIHTATLLHDDVVDNSLLRRKQQTANAIWGNEASVLVGDFVYSRSFQLMVQLNNMDIMSILANTTNKISEGEVLQLMNRHNPNMSQQTYLDVIRAKTAVLFSAAAKLSAVIANSRPEIITAMENYGLNLGMAFQLIDDVLDYSADPQELGKNIMHDLADGKSTLPLLIALQKGSTEQQKCIQQAITHGTLSNIEIIQEAIASTEAIAYTYQLAKEQINAATQSLAIIPVSPYCDALFSLAEFAITRTY